MQKSEKKRKKKKGEKKLTGQLTARGGEVADYESPPRG